MKYETYHETLGAVILEVHSVLIANGIELVDADAFINHFHSLPISYGQTEQAHAEIKAIKGKSTKKWAHVTIYRLDSGRYELTLYVF